MRVYLLSYSRPWGCPIYFNRKGGPKWIASNAALLVLDNSRLLLLFPQVRKQGEGKTEQGKKEDRERRNKKLGIFTRGESQDEKR